MWWLVGIMQWLAMFHLRNRDHYWQAATGDFPECMVDGISRRNALNSTGDSSVISLCPTVLPRILPLIFVNME